MPDTFYHVDQYGELEVGSTLKLEWPPRITNNLVTTSSEENMEAIQELYPEGLSRHGVKYAQIGLVTEELENLRDGWQAMAGVIESHDISTGKSGKNYFTAYNTFYEHMFELYRMMEFEDENSRFQSYFAVEELEDAVEFAERHRREDSAIFEVRCENYDIRDMELVKMKYFGEVFANGEKYWKGKSGSDPDWEVVMEPPVEVVDIVDV